MYLGPRFEVLVQARLSKFSNWNYDTSSTMTIVRRNAESCRTRAEPGCRKGSETRFGGSFALAVSVVDRITNQIEQYMDLLSSRQKLVASNIANADTPGYKTKDIDFQFEFESQMANVSPTAVEVSGLKTKNDGNNVDMAREARLLAENALRFRVAC